jgi:chemosensory pili system protein ChpA (sensor histidine kinase/response regulator)
VQTALHRFHQRLAVLEDDNPTSYPRDDEQLIGELAGLAALEDDAAPASDVESPEPEVPEEVVETAEAAIDAAQAEEPPQEEVEQAAAEVQIEDGSIIAIFLEEAVEVLERCDTLLNTWRDKLSDRKLVQNLQREIHTFKGGARMAGLEEMGELSHAMESLLEHIAANRLEATVAVVQALEEGCDNLNLFVEQLQSGKMPQAGNALARFEKKVKALRMPTESPAEEDLPKDKKEKKVAPAAPKPEPSDEQPAARKRPAPPTKEVK